jgi:serine/threonine-protein kinase
MITRGGAVKVMDFGIARALADGQNMTQTAAVIGTAQYLSPEQARGEAVDARSDVYAAGCVLFELLTGEPPFSGDSPVAVAYQHVREDVRRPSEVNPDVPAELDAVVLKAMSKNPANRYQSAAEMRSDLVRVLRGQRPLAPAVMSEEDRTEMLGGGGQRRRGAATAVIGTGQTRRLTAPPARHGTAAATWSPGEPPPRSTAKVVAVALGVAALLANIAFVATRLFGGPVAPEQVAVPNVAGQVQEAARESLSSAGFRPNIQREASSASTVGQAIRTDPAAGQKAAKGSQVTVFIGTGPAQVTVPDLSGKSASEASLALQAAGLTLANRKTAPTTDDTMVNKVIAQDPKSGATVAGQSAVTITLGVKSNTLTVPSLTGQPIDQAQRQLEQMGLSVEVTDVDGPGQRDTVLRTSPAANQQVPAGGMVTLYASRGNQLSMPDLRNKTLDDAQRALSDAGFDGDLRTNRAEVTDPTLDGIVLSQSVAPGSGVDRDGSVQLTVGAYKGGRNGGNGNNNDRNRDRNGN